MNALAARIRIALLALSSTFAGCGVFFGDPGAALVVGDAERDLHGTMVCGDLGTAHAAGRNLLYCATLQLAWDRACDLVGGDLHLSGAPGLADRLNAGEGADARLDAPSFAARAGRIGDGILDAIRADLKRFPDLRVPVPDDGALSEDDFVAFACLSKDLPFAVPLYAKPLVFGDREVDGFGVWHDERTEHWSDVAEQVGVLAFESPKEFLVELQTRGRDDRLLLHRTVPGQTLQETVERTLALAARAEPEPLRVQDRFQAPAFDFDVARAFHELEGRAFGNAGFERARFLSVVQDIRFKLDENGALLRSWTMALGAAVAPGPRTMILDGPFLVLLIRRDASAPYFAMWIENDELMIRAD